MILTPYGRLTKVLRRSKLALWPAGRLWRANTLASRRRLAGSVKVLLSGTFLLVATPASFGVSNVPSPLSPSVHFPFREELHLPRACSHRLSSLRLPGYVFFGLSYLWGEVKWQFVSKICLAEYSPLSCNACSTMIEYAVRRLKWCRLSFAESSQGSVHSDRHDALSRSRLNPTCGIPQSGLSRYPLSLCFHPTFNST